jgi:SAM-dependent methyltransferase
MSDFRIEWPFESYASAWLQFRALSDECQLTAKHILSRHGWPRSSDLRLADFGCGDGRLIEALIVSSQQYIDTVHLIDVNPELLAQAQARIERLGLVKNVEAHCASAGDGMLQLGREIDVALAIHLLYLLNEQETHRFLGGLAPGVSLFVVLDHPTSVFMRLQEKTAPEFYARSLNAHRALAGLDKQGCLVEQTAFETHLTSALDLSQEQRDSVLSLLCYRDFRALDCETQAWAARVVSEHNVAGRIVCNCVCYAVDFGR